MTITKLNTKKLSDSTPITCIPQLLEWIVDNQISSYKNKQKNLAQNLNNELTTLFGKRNLSKRLEKLTNIWILNYENTQYNIFTSKKGTYIEVCTDYQNLEPLKPNIINFLTELHTLINK